MALPLSMTCGPYDRARALIEGTVQPAGVELAITVDADDNRRQIASRNGQFDVCEFFTVAYLADLPYKTLGFTAIPIFVKRMFRHSSIYVNQQAGIRSPADLHGRRIGIQAWTTTAALWGRAILAEEHGLDLGSVTWVAQRPDNVGAWEPPAWLRLEYVPPGQTLHDLLATGAVDAAITTETWAPDGHPNIAYLFPDHATREREYYRQTGIFPIHHILLVRTAVLDEHPWVAMSLFDAWQESKERCYEWLEWQRVHQTSLWFRALWEEERAAAGRDIYPWGFRRTRHEVDKLLDYAFQQAITPRKFAPEELFHPSTLTT